MSDFAMPVQPDQQADLFDRLEDKGLSRKLFSYFTGINRRTADRIYCGQTSLRFGDAKTILQHADADVTGELARDFCRFTHYLPVLLLEEPVSKIEEGLIGTLREYAELLAQRREDMSDGVFDPAEQRAELDRIDGIIEQLHQLRVGIAEQKTNKRHKLGITGQNGGAA